VIEPLVSVVIPAFNAAEWIAATLASVAASTYPRERLEVVVVDDGSRDRTAEIAADQLRSSGLPHVVLRRDATQGPAVARNDGWRRARGEWLQFLDADDLIARDKISRQVRGALEADLRVAAVVSPWGALRERQGQWVPDEATVDPKIDDDALASVLRADNFIATGSQLFRRRWLETVDGYDARHRLVEDVDLLIRLVIAGGELRRVPADAPLFWYRRRAGSLSSSDDRAFIDAQVRNARLVEEHWRHTDQLTAGRRQFLADLYSGAVRRLAVDDPESFERMADHIDALRPAFVPSEPNGLRRLARVMGYRRAERAAGRYRQIKGLVKR